MVQKASQHYRKREALACLSHRKLHLVRHNDLQQSRGEVDDLVGLKTNQYI